MRGCGKAGGAIFEEGQTACCYAKSEKSWIDDPAGISWETFHTTGESTDYGTSVQRGAQIAHAKACCEPQARRADRRRRLLHRLSHASDRSIRPLPLHRQFGALDHRRGHPEQDRRGTIPRLQRRKPAERPGQPAHAQLLEVARLRDIRMLLEVLDCVRAAGRAGFGFRFHGLRQRSRRSLPGVAGPADDRALGCTRPGGSDRHRRRDRARVQGRLPDAAPAHRNFHRAADPQPRPAQPATAAG